MKRLMTVTASALLILIFGMAPLFSSGENIVYPPVKEVKLPNGLSGFYIKDELPQLTIVVSVGFGRLYENRNTAGLSNLVAKTLSLCGTKKYPGSALHEKIESIGGKLSISSGWEETVVVIRVLERFREEAFSLLGEILLAPAFNEKDFINARTLVSDEVRRSYDDPANIAFEKTREIIFDGAGYGSVATVRGINGFSLSDVKAAWKKYFTAANVKAGILTSLSFEETESLMKKHLSKMIAGKAIDYETEYNKVADSVREKAGKIYFYEKDIPQSTVVIGTVAPEIDKPSVYPLSLMNYLLGGGSFNSRLMREIRVERGLAYAVGSVVRPRKKTGVFLAYAQTKNSAVTEVLSIMLKNTNLMSEKDIDKKELEWAKKSILNSYIFNFDSPMNILNNYMTIVYNGLPGDYYREYPSNIKKTTAQDIKNASKQLFKSGIVRVVVGNRSVKKDLAKFGEVVDIKLETEK